ncbi:MAG: RodZ domain-containing protein [Hyphomicrobiales bacterium]
MSSSSPDLFAQSNQKTQNANLGSIQEAGWWLQRERELVGARIDDVVAATRIEPEHILALEEGRLDDLPERNQTLDIIWAYSDFLMLEPGPLCNHYAKLLPQQAPRRTLDVQQTEFKGIGMMSRFLTPRIAVNPMVAGAFAGTLLIAAVAWTLIPGGDSTEGEQLAEVTPLDQPEVDNIVTGSIPENTPEPELPVANKVSDMQLGGSEEQGYEQSGLTELIKRTVSESTKKQQTEAKSQPAEAAPKKKVEAPKPAGPTGQVYGTANKNSRLFIQAENRVYVRIEDEGGTVVFNQTLNAGDGFKVPDRKGLVLVARDGGALRYVVDGKRSGKLGETGEILVGRSLDLEKLGSKG